MASFVLGLLGLAIEQHNRSDVCPLVISRFDQAREMNVMVSMSLVVCNLCPNKLVERWYKNKSGREL
jgi:hypothetical protein